MPSNKKCARGSFILNKGNSFFNEGFWPYSHKLPLNEHNAPYFWALDKPFAVNHSH